MSAGLAAGIQTGINVGTDVVDTVAGIGESLFGFGGDKQKRLRQFARGNPCDGRWSPSAVGRALANAPRSVREEASRLVADFSDDFPQSISPDRPGLLGNMAVAGAHGGFDCDVGGREEDLRAFIPEVLAQYGTSGAVDNPQTTTRRRDSGGGGGGLLDQLGDIAEKVVRPDRIADRAEAAAKGGLGGAEAGAQVADARQRAQAGRMDPLVTIAVVLVGFFLISSIFGS